MRIGGPAARGQRGRVAWTGGAALLAVLLQFLQQRVEAFHLNTSVLWLITALIFVAGLGIDRLRQRDARGRRRTSSKPRSTRPSRAGRRAASRR